MIDNLATWKTTFQAITGEIPGFSSWIDGRVTQKAGLTGIIPADPTVVFTFDKAEFQSGMEALPLSANQVTAITALGAVWESAIQTSILTISPGDSVGAPTPATIFSVVTSSVIDPASILVSKAALISSLIATPPVADSADSALPQAFRDAFLLLTGTAIGLDSTPTPIGPLPLVVAAAPFV